MKYLKPYKIFESKDDIVEYLQDIALDISDEGFLVEVNEPNIKNMCRYCISIISSPGEKAEPFKLRDIKEVVCRMKDYMESLDYFIESVDISGPTFKNFGKIEGDFKDPYEWDEDLGLIIINIYFDTDIIEESKIFESSIDELEDDVTDILLDLEDKGFKIDMDREFDVNSDITQAIHQKNSMVKSILLSVTIEKEFSMQKPSIFYWDEVKEEIIRLTEWYYSYSDRDYSPGINSKIVSDLRKMGIDYKSNAPLRFFRSKDEFAIGYHKEEDFKDIWDDLAFTKLYLKIRV
jgi:hypothetical protein